MLRIAEARQQRLAIDHCQRAAVQSTLEAKARVGVQLLRTDCGQTCVHILATVGRWIVALEMRCRRRLARGWRAAWRRCGGRRCGWHACGSGGDQRAIGGTQMNNFVHRKGKQTVVARNNIVAAEKRTGTRNKRSARRDEWATNNEWRVLLGCTFPFAWVATNHLRTKQQCHRPTKQVGLWSTLDKYQQAYPKTVQQSNLDRVVKTNVKNGSTLVVVPFWVLSMVTLVAMAPTPKVHLVDVGCCTEESDEKRPSLLLRRTKCDFISIKVSASAPQIPKGTEVAWIWLERTVLQRTSLFQKFYFDMFKFNKLFA